MNKDTVFYGSGESDNGDDNKPVRKVMKRVAVKRKDGKELVLHEVIVTAYTGPDNTPDSGQVSHFGTLDDNSVYDESLPVVSCNNGHIVQGLITCPRCRKTMCKTPGCHGTNCVGIECPFCGKTFECKYG
ncbi:MAG: hypothetical protein LHV68_09980 [Elusimicrobia bacterium]|nr:hypothetical protein [Candidatus Liberimonas magnetica]